MDYRDAKRMKIGFRLQKEFPEEICVEILARLPLRSIMRFKAVCRGWRRVTETLHFHRKFMFAHRNSSSSLSIMQGSYGWSSKEVFGFYGCERYGLSRSLCSYIQPHEQGDKNTIIDCVDGLVLLQTISSEGRETYRVGNPVLKQWVQLPPYLSKVLITGLVTRVEDSVVVEYKVVFMDEEYLGLVPINGVLPWQWRNPITVDIYSSKTGKWIRKHVRCPRRVYSLKYQTSLSLNKKLHWFDAHEGAALVVYDFFAAQQQQCQVIPFPNSEKCSRRFYTISGGFVVYITETYPRLRLWRLEEYTSDSGRWQFMQDINLISFGCERYFPVAIHPFETHIIYMAIRDRALCSYDLVSIDLKTQKVTCHIKSSNHSDKMLSNYLHDLYSYVASGLYTRIFYAQQFTLPQWMGSIPSK